MKRAIGAELWKSDVPGPTKERECHLVGYRGEGTGRAASWLRQSRSAPAPLYCSRECGETGRLPVEIGPLEGRSLGL